MKPIIFFHTAESNERKFAALAAELAPDMPVEHARADDLLEAAVKAGDLTPEIREEARQRMAALAGRASVVVCTCSTLGPASDDADVQCAVPVQRIDRALADWAFAQGKKVLVVAAVESTLGPSQTLFMDVAMHKGVQAVIHTLWVEEAWPKFMAGDEAGYLQAIADRVREAAPGFDAIALAQASMSGAKELLANLPIPVEASPVPGVLKAVEAANA